MAKVMIVDDAAFMRMQIKSMLSKNGYEVAGEAENGLQAVELYKKLRPDVVTMDITMPKMNGLDALGEIIKIDSNAKVVMISVMSMDTIKRQAISSGAKDFIAKPFKEKRLIASVKKYC